MKAEYINPFIASLVNTFRTMAQMEVKRGKLHVRQPDTPSYPISGVIGLSGNAVGTVVVNVSEELALHAASVMLMEECSKIDEDVLDAVGELTNMVAGRAKAELEEFNLSVSLPNMVTGVNHEVHFPSDVTPICVPFDTDHGPVLLEVGLEPVASRSDSPEAAAATA